MKTETSLAYKLIADGSLINFEITNEAIQATTDGENFDVTVDLQMTDEDGTPCADDVAWGAFGFIFVIAVFSFADARPRGYSNIDYAEKDEFTVAHLFDCLEFSGGTLVFYADYIEGRCLKTGIVVRKDGSVSINTVNRGKALLYWLDRLKGNKKLRIVK